MGREEEMREGRGRQGVRVRMARRGGKGGEDEGKGREGKTRAGNGKRVTKRQS